MQAARPDHHVIHPWVQEGLQQLRAGVGFLDTGIDWQRTTEYVQAAEELGYDSIWVPDHPLLMPDCWAHLAALAAITHTMRLGPLVNCIGYRSPLALARSANDIDRWSQGRLVLGLGIGDFDFEFAQLGLPVRSVRQRQAALEEVVQILQGVWSGAPFAFSGTYFQIPPVEVAFGPVQQPHIPLLIAGGGERVTLRQVAQYADASNFGPAAELGGAFTLEDVVRKNEVITRYCQTFGRPASPILPTHSMIPLLLGKTLAEAAAKLDLMPPPMRSMLEPAAMVATVETAIERYRALARAGMQYFIIVLVPGDLQTLHLFKEQVLPAATS